MLDNAAAWAALQRLRRLAWGAPALAHQGSLLALLRTYLHRAALVAQALARPGQGDGSWPWFDAAARLPLPGGAARPLPGYVFLDPEPDYRGPGSDPLEDEVIAVFRELAGQQLTAAMRDTCLFYVRWEALKNHPAVQALALPDLYEPLIRFYERGGWFRMEHGDYIDLGGAMLGRGSPASYAQHPALASFDPAALDALDRAYNA